LHNQNYINSWSYYRHNIFKYCERKYFYHCFAATNGWKTTSTKKEQKLYLLKQITPYKLWIENLIVKNIKKTFLLSNTITPNEFTKSFQQALYKEFLSNKHKICTSFEKDMPKHPIIKEIFIDKIPKKTVLSLAEKHLELLNSIIMDSKLIRQFNKIPFQAKQNTSTPLYFYLDNIKVWTAPHLSWFINGKIFSLNFYFSTKLSNLINGNWDTIAGINSLYWQRKPHAYINKIENINIFTNYLNKKISTVYGGINPTKAIKIIKDSHRIIKSRLTTTQKEYEKNYSKTKDKNNCSNCNFKEFCHI
jgi:hypothetical protein